MALPHRLVPALAGLLLAAAPAAAGAATWSPPETVPGSEGENVSFPELTFTSSGREVVAWRGAILRLGRTTPAFRVAHTPGAPWRTPLEEADLAAGPVTYGRTRVATVVAHRSASDRTAIVANLGTTTGFFGPDRTLARGVRLDADPALAGNVHGDMAVAWSQAAGANDHLMLSLRHPGGRFGAPTVLRGTGHVTDVVVAYGDRGDTLVAYQRSAVNPSTRRLTDRIEVRLRRAGHHFGSPQVLGASRGGAEIAAAVAPDGRAYVLWSEHDGGEEVNEPLTVNAATAAPSHATFGRGHQIAHAPAAGPPQGLPHVTVDRTGDATAAFSVPTGTTGARVEVTTAAAGHLFAPPATLADDGVLQDLAGTAAGAAVAVWTGGYAATFTPRPVRAAFRPAGAGAFGPAEEVAPAPEDPGAASAAFDALGRPAVAWVGRPGYRGEFPPAERLAVRLAVRTP